ncbi:MAG: hypothetical protein EXR71_00685 [Myxococcales bacterium]|nr:hypothetical protein [Myxococcales bacterium]
MLLVVAFAFARPVDPALPDARMSSVLARAWRAKDDPEAPIGAMVQVVASLRPGTDARAFAARLKLPVEATIGELVQLSVPRARLGEVASQPEVLQLREPHRAYPKEVVSEGYAATMLTDWHLDDRVTGAGVTVGVLDVGFDGVEVLLGGELPSEVTTDFSRGAPDSSSHGAGVAEIIHDFAPDAELTLTTFGTEVEFGEALQSLLDAQVDVLNCSVGFDNTGHADGTSAVTRYADGMVDGGVLMVTAAGNEARRYRIGPLSAEAASQYINIGDHYSTKVNAPNGRVHVSFRWSEPFGEAATDLDLVVFEAETQRECGRSENPQDGDDDPFEEVQVADCGESAYAAVFTEPGTDVSGLTGYLHARSGVADEEATLVQSLSLPADCFACIATGAYTMEDDSIPDYSSRGPTNDGRTKPDFVGPSGVHTATTGEEGFTGSSAAAAHASGLAALWVQATGVHDDPGAFLAWAEEGARDLGGEGFDNVAGRGALAADEVPPLACGCQGAGRLASWGGLLAGLLLAARRRA